MRVTMLILTSAFCAVRLQPLLSGAPVTNSDQGPILIDEINSRGVLGRLGHPLGTVLTVEGVVFCGDAVPNKNHEGRIWLDVQTVDGQSLDETERFQFDLKEFAPHGIDIDDDDLPPIMTESHGDGFKCLVFETGGFTGGPRDGIIDVPIQAGRFWRFESQLVVIRDLGSTDN